MPGYAWPSYAAYPNYAAVTYPKQYSPTAWPYIGPFYPYPQVPLGWRKVTLGMERRLVVPRLQGFALRPTERVAYAVEFLGERREAQGQPSLGFFRRPMYRTANAERIC